jgi:hypothetical protein
MKKVAAAWKSDAATDLQFLFVLMIKRQPGVLA